jgi:hypothetical protein
MVTAQNANAFCSYNRHKNMDIDWKEYKTKLREERKLRRGPRITEIMGLAKLGHKVVHLTPYQYRINNEVDVYPTNNRYCILRFNRWGGYNNVTEFIIKTCLKK